MPAASHIPVHVIFSLDAKEVGEGTTDVAVPLLVVPVPEVVPFFAVVPLAADDDDPVVVVA